MIDMIKYQRKVKLVMPSIEFVITATNDTIPPIIKRIPVAILRCLRVTVEKS
jgi:hypothetical protein